MNNFLKNILVNEEDLEKYSRIVDNERSKNNSIRGYYSMFFGIAIELILIVFVDFVNIGSTGFSQMNTLYLIFHSLLFIFSLLIVYLTWLYRNKPESKLFKELSFDTIIIMVMSIYLGLIAMINGVDQLHTSSTTTYMFFVLIFSIMIYMPPKKMMIILLISHACFIIGMFLYQSNHSVLIHNLVNGTINMLVAFIASIVSYNTFFTRVVNQTKLEEATQMLENLSYIDPLTNCYNRRFGYMRITEEMSRSNRLNVSIGLLMIDIDDFKDINDNYGHLVGDKVLVEFTNILNQILRKEDVLIRYGGEEFVVLLINSGPKETEVVAYKILSRFGKYVFEHEDINLDLTVSIGGTSYPDCGCGNVDELLNRIDQNMYEVKRSGKNDFRVI